MAKKMIMRKVLSLFFVFVILSSAVPFSVLASDSSDDVVDSFGGDDTHEGVAVNGFDDATNEMAYVLSDGNIRDSASSSLSGVITHDRIVASGSAEVVSAWSSTDQSITVLVKYPDDSTVTPDTILILYNTSWNEVKRADTNDITRYTFTDLDVGTYHVEAYKDNMFVGSGNTDVAAGEGEFVTITTLYKRNLEANVYYNDGSTPIEDATVIVYSWDGYKNTWDYEYRGITNSQGKVTFSSWPTSISGEKYKLEALHNGYSKTVEDVTVDKASGSSYKINLAEPVSKGSITVTVKYPGGSAVTPDTAILYDSGGDEIKRLNPTSNTYTFTDLNAGTYHTDAYKDNMWIGDKTDINLNPGEGKSVTITTLYKRNLEANVYYNDGSTPIEDATVIVYSWDGYKNTWNYEYRGITNSQGKVTFSSWPTSISGEMYKLEVTHDGYSKTVEPAYVDKSIGSSYSIILNKPALHSLKVIVKNIVGNSLPLSGGTIDVVLYDNEYKPIETKSKTYSGGESSVQVEFDNIADDDYYIEVYNTANTGLKLREFWGADEVTVSGSTTKDFVRHTQCVSDIKINGESPYGNEIRVNAGEKVHVDITVKNNEGGYKNVKVRLILDRDKSSSYDFDETHGPVNVQKNDYGYFDYDFSPSQAGTYYFYIITSGYYNDKYTVTDQHDWYKAFNAIEVLKGYGAWIYGKEMDYITAISNYNGVSSDEKDIKYLFCRVGGLNLENQEVIGYDSSITSYYKTNLPNCLIYPMLDASGNLGDLSSSELDTLAHSIADEINADSNADGIHLDIEPYDDNLVELVDVISPKTSKPVTVAIGITNPPDDLFTSCEIVVLMNYDLDTNWDIYGNKAKINANNFLRAATTAGGYGMIGIPAVATHHEYEYRINKNDGSTESTGYLMIDYLVPAIRAVEDAIQNVGDEYYVGMSIWSFLNEPVGLYDSGDWKYYPYGISEEEWDFLKGIDTEITSWNVASGTFYPGDLVEATVTVKNTGSIENIFYVGYSVKDPNGDYLDAPYASVYLDAGSSNTIRLYWTVPDSPVVGSYGATVAVWIKEFETSIGFLHGRLDLEGENGLFDVGDKPPRFLSVPYEWQNNASWCTPASCAMVLQYYGVYHLADDEFRPIHHWDIAKFYGLEKQDGTRLKDLERYFKHLNKVNPFNIKVPLIWESFPSPFTNIPDNVRDDILSSLNENIPVLVGGEWTVLPDKHTVVIVGYEIIDGDDIILYIHDPSGALTEGYEKDGKRIEGIAKVKRRIAAPVTWEDFNKFKFATSTIVMAITADVLYPIKGDGSLEFYNFEIKNKKFENIFYADYNKGLMWHDGATKESLCSVEESVDVSWQDFDCIALTILVSNHQKTRQSFEVGVKIAETGKSKTEKIDGFTWANFVNFYFFKKDMSPGDYSLYIHLYDIGGGLADKIGPFKFKIEGDDTKPPETKCTLAPSSPNGENGWYISSVTVTLESTDPSGIEWIKYRIDSNPWQTSPEEQVSFTISKDGLHFITYYAKDKAGNVEEPKISTFFYIDQTNPSASISINYGAESTNSRSVSLSLSYADATSGVKDCSYKNEGESWSSWESCSSTKSWTLAAGEGTKRVYYQVRDNAGNIKEVQDTIVVQEDKLEPKLCTAPDPPSTNFGTVPQNQTRTWEFFITNCGSDTLTWTISSDQPSWINVNPTSGSTTTGADVVTVTIDTQGLAPETYTGHITITSNDGSKTGTITVNVQKEPDKLPDLQIHSMLIEPNPCKSTDVVYTNFDFKNAGDEDVSAFDATLLFEGEVIEVFEIPGVVKPAESFPASIWIKTPKKGEYMVCLDYSNRIKESNEDNNCASAYLDVTAPNQPPVNPTLTPNKAEPQNAGTSITWTASATDPDGDPLYYRFWIKGPTTGNLWTIKRGWSSINTWTWYTTASDVGDTDISVWIRDGNHASTSSYDLEKVYSGYIIQSEGNQPPVNPALTPNKAEPQNAGTSITWTASAIDPDGDTLYYRFWIKGPATGNLWTIKRDWSSINTWTWYTTASDVGDTDISVWIRDGHHAPPDKYDIEKIVYGYKINPVEKKRPTATIDSITPNPATQGDDTVRFKGHGSDSDGYIVDYYWKSSKDGFLSSSKEFTRSASNLAVGIHTIYFKVKDDDGQWSDWATATLTIKKSITGKPDLIVSSINFNPNPASAGDDVVVSVTVKNQGKGDAGAHDEFLGQPYATIIHKEWHCSGLKAGASKTFTHTLKNVQESVTYEACADIGGVVAESDDDNNCQTAYLEVKEVPKYVKFRGVVAGTSPEGLIGAIHWYVNVDEWLSGSLSCDEIDVVIGMYPPFGSWDENICKGDRVEAYGEVNPWGEGKCTVGLNGESYYIKKI
jgi:hypothetical protein